MKEHIEIANKSGSSTPGEFDKVRIGNRMYRPRPRKIKLVDK